MLYRSTLQLLRFHFSFFLMPVFLFAVSQVKTVDWQKVLFSFLVLHLLVYPASNGYNSYMDRDNSPIGGLEKPMQPTKQLLRISVVMDVLAIIFSLFINYVFALGILFYILASRAYSYRRIRLKKYPVSGFITVFIFQGAAIFLSVYYACSADFDVVVPATACLISSLLVGALYPLTQIYQHEADKKDGVTTISYLLGKKGSFVFSGLQFLTATLLLYFYFSGKDEIGNFWLFLGYTFPVVLFFCYWMFKVWRDNSEANFNNSLIMNIVAMFCTSSYFASLIYIQHFE
jgi:1,4-dihydroxy-2-naphthoate octaprenyltransferase